jgi:hypothetical protein
VAPHRLGELLTAEEYHQLTALMQLDEQRTAT